MPHGDNADFPLLKYLDGLVDRLRELMSAAIRGQDIDAVHDARVATRRLKAATGLLQAVVSTRCRKPFNKVTKRLRRQLGPLRDLDVMLEHVDQVKQAKFDLAVQWLKERLDAGRAKAVESARDNAPPARMLARLGVWWGLRHEIIDVRQSITSLLVESVHLQLDAFVEQAEDLTQSRHSDPHQLRIAGKSLRYTLEMAKEHGLHLPRSVVSTFKRMQTLLGLWHDYVVLTERMLCETVDCDLALHDPALQEQILSLAQVMLRKAQVQLARMSALWKSKGSLLAETIRQAFPLTPHVAATEGPKVEGEPAPPVAPPAPADPATAATPETPSKTPDPLSRGSGVFNGH